MKKIFSLLLSMIMVCSLFVTANAASELAGAKNYTLGKFQSGSLTESNKSDSYKFILPKSGTLEITVEADFEYIYLEIYDENGVGVYSHCERWNSTLESLKCEKQAELTSGIYYISFKGIHPGYNGEYFGKYSFNLSFESANETFDDKQGGLNNTIKESSKIDFFNQYNGHIALNDKKDIYRFELTSSSKVKFTAEGTLEYLFANIYDANGNSVWNHCEHWNNTMNYLKCEKDIELTSGTYYISFEGIHPGYNGEYFGKYSFNLYFESANETFDDKQDGTNNKINEASNITVNQKYNGHIALNDKKDIYRFELTSSSKVKFTAEGTLEYLFANIYDANGNSVWNHCEHWNNTMNYLKCEKDIELTSGTYYISFEGIHPGYNGEYFGKYSFNVSDGRIAPVPSAISVLVNGKPVSFDQPPILENGRTLVPLRAIFEALGAEVLWDGSTQTVTATKGGTQISLQIGSTKMYVNNSAKTLDVPAKLINSRTLVPVRAISEAFGCQVDWIQNTQTVVITQ